MKNIYKAEIKSNNVKGGSYYVWTKLEKGQVTFTSLEKEAQPISSAELSEFVKAHPFMSAIWEKIEN